MTQAKLIDCLEYMRGLPDLAFDLAICDPPYGGVTQGGYMQNKISGGLAHNRNNYHLGLWA
ncbi:MAG: hypothetical protein IKO68_08375 [Oscillospiraceae bacterium]|nr:hypothetical protein [Oscillospiraceae bacterium]